MASCPVRSWDEVVKLYSRWTIGASGAHTKKSGFPGTGFASVARTAAGKFTITFARGLPVGGLIDLEVKVWKAANSETTTARATVSGYTAETAGAAATALFETWEIDETAAQVDPASGDEVTIIATFLKTKGT